MATVESTQRESSISSDALGLLDCFSCGFDELIYRLAEHVAVERIGRTNEVEITVVDFEKAAGMFAKNIKQSDLPEDVKSEADAMLTCLSKKMRR